MLKKNIKKISICLISIIMVVSVASKTLATDNKSVEEMLNEMKTNSTNTTANGNENANEIEEGTRNNTALNTNTNTNTDATAATNANNNNVPTTTPYTGIENYSSVFFIFVFAASAIYAYKKIRDYNA